MKIEYVAIIVLAIIGIGLLSIGLNDNNWDHGTAEITVPIKNEVERAIGVESLENKFVYVTRVTWGGAGAGGLGAPQIFTGSADKFIELIPPEEPVYVTLEYVKTQSGYENKRVIKKVYWAFIEDRPPVMIYEDVYSHSRDGYPSDIVRFNETEVVFTYDYGGGQWFLEILCQVVGIGLLLFVIIGIVDMAYRYYNPPKKESEEDNYPDQRDLFF